MIQSFYLCLFGGDGAGGGGHFRSGGVTLSDFPNLRPTVTTKHSSYCQIYSLCLEEGSDEFSLLRLE